MFSLKPVLLVPFIFVLFGVNPAIAGLPASVDGEDLPTLAPIVERTRPAVVNIATKGHVNVQNNPLLNDPFIRRFFEGFGNDMP